MMDVTPSQEMVDEGIAREVVNKIQKLRKKVRRRRRRRRREGRGWEGRGMVSLVLGPNPLMRRNSLEQSNFLG